MKPKSIIVHSSASRWGNAAIIREWHRTRGFSDIGYHAVILNGYRTSAMRYKDVLDGKIEPGRVDTIRGAHCKAGSMNYRALGVCLIGTIGWEEYPTPRQISALVHYLVTKCRAYAIPVSKITQHSTHEPKKPLCASLDINQIREKVQEVLG